MLAILTHSLPKVAAATQANSLLRAGNNPNVLAQSSKSLASFPQISKYQEIFRHHSTDFEKICISL
jgi:hypothetical protein